MKQEGDFSLHEARKKHFTVWHYYGDITRKLFMLAGFVMIITLPLLSSLLPVPLIIAIGAVIIIAVVAGLLSPVNKKVVFLNLLISMGGVAAYEYYAIRSFTLGENDLLFWTNQALAVIFFFALYFSSKTLRSISRG